MKVHLSVRTMGYKKEDKMGKPSLVVPLSQTAADSHTTEGFLTGEQLMQVSMTKLATLKAMYRQKLGFDTTLAV